MESKYIGETLDGRYEMLEVIGEGGMSVVYKAVDKTLNRNVAIKMLREDLAVDEEFLRRFQTESQAVAQLSHPNIVGIYDVSKSTEQEYIVMELIEGVTLKQYMKLKGALSDKETAHFMTQVCKALAHAHSRGIVHRDIKPHNILISKADGSLKVADFGIARLVDSQHTKVTETLGSVHYISPEQAQGEAVDARTDIYSAGIMMYEMLTGELPYSGSTPIAIAMQHIEGNPLRPSELAPDISDILEAITLKAMEPDREYRYESAEDMLLDLDYYKRMTAENPEASDEGRQKRYLIFKNVPPVSRTGELSEEAYKRRRGRAGKVSTLAGFLCVIAFMLVLVVFLWNYWFEDMFADRVPVYVPNFVGSDYQDMAEIHEGTFTFEVTLVQDSSRAAGIILEQIPNAGEELSKTSVPIPVQLRVSAGEQSVIMQNMVNKEYRQVVDQLTQMGLNVSLESVTSPSVTRDYVISTVPAYGEEVIVGSTVTVIFSLGPEQVMVQVPSLWGMPLEEASNKLESVNLNTGDITHASSDYPAGSVIDQNPSAGIEMAERSKVSLVISEGRRADTPAENGT